MTVMIRYMRLDHLLMGAGVALLLIVTAQHRRVEPAILTELDMKLGALAAGLFVWFGIMCKAWRERESRQWVWFIYGAVTMLGVQFFSSVFLERFSDLYLTLWVHAFKAGLI